jgi:hypothetical protein
MVKFVAKVKRIHFSALTSCGTNYFLIVKTIKILRNLRFNAWTINFLDIEVMIYHVIYFKK